MLTVLVALRDPIQREHVRAAFRLFPTLRPLTVDRDRVMDYIGDRTLADALILDYEGNRRGDDPVLADIRARNPHIALLVVADRPERAHFNKVKMEHQVLSFVPLPLEPFDLARRLQRLAETRNPA
jgi:hypothetical protein